MMSYKRTEPGVEYQWATDKNYTAFWNQYKFLVVNYWSYYHHLLNKYNLDSDFADLNDFYCASWLIIKKAVDAIKPKNIPDKDKWWGYMQISFYLRNWVNRDLIIKRLKEKAVIFKEAKQVNVLRKEGL